MINFDTKFEAFVKKWYRKNAAKYAPEQMEERINEIYDEWAETPDAELGTSPLEYFRGIKGAAELIKTLRDYHEEGLPYPNLLLDRIVEERACEKFLVKMLDEEEGDEHGHDGYGCGCDCCGGGNLRTLAINLLAEKDSRAGYKRYIEWLFDSRADMHLRELAAETLSQDAEYVKEEILKRVPSEDCFADDLAAYILVNCPGDKRVTRFLTELFLSGEDGQLYADYLGRYGDADAIPHLYDAAETCDYITYIEIINALEALGETPLIKRDFSSDPNYKKVRGDR